MDAKLAIPWLESIKGRQWAESEALDLAIAALKAQAEGLTIADYEQALQSTRDLTRRLDVALNGDNAAQQASLCDIVAQVEQEGIKAQGEAEAEPVAWLLKWFDKGQPIELACMTEEEAKGYAEEVPRGRPKVTPLYTRPAPVRDRNKDGAEEFIDALIFNNPIWPNNWGQDVAAAAFFLTDSGTRAKAKDGPGLSDLMAGKSLSSGLIPQHLAAPAEPVSVPEGWQLVPIVPTQPMLRAWAEAQTIEGYSQDTRRDYAAPYRAMLAAAPAAGGDE